MTTSIPYLHRTEQFPLRLFGKVYIWTREPGKPLKLEAAHGPDGFPTATALQRVSEMN